MTAGPTSAFPTLQTARLRLREIVPEDAPALLAIHGDAEAMRWFGNDPIHTLEQARGLVEAFAGWRRAAVPGTRWGLEWQGRLVGSAGLFKWNRGWASATVGYELARDVQGQGLMSEALRALLPWGVAQMGLRRVEALVHPENTPSLALLQRLGFEVEGRQRQAGAWGGQRHDLLMLGWLA